MTKPNDPDAGDRAEQKPKAPAKPLKSGERQHLYRGGSKRPAAPPGPMDRDGLIAQANSDLERVTVRMVDLVELAGEHSNNPAAQNIAAAFAGRDGMHTIARSTLRELLGLV